MKTEVIPCSNPNAIPKALKVIQDGGGVAFPTDTVYGVGVLAFDPEAVRKLFLIKERNQKKAIPILVNSLDDVELVAEIFPASAQKITERFWPGPLTLVLNRHARVPEIISPDPTIGVRMPDNPIALELLAAAGPLAVSSANLSGAGSSSTAQEVEEQLGGRVSLILDGGRTHGGVPSTVVDCTGSELKIIRSGPIRLNDLND